MERIITLAQGLAVVVSAALVAFVLYRSKTAKLLRDERDAYKEKSERVESEMADCLAESHRKDVLIVELQARTDLTDVRAGQTAIMEILSKHVQADLDVQLRLSDTFVEVKTGMLAMAHTLEAMEKRLHKGLIMK